MTDAPEPGVGHDDVSPATSGAPEIGSLPSGVRRQIAHYARAVLPDLQLREIPAPLRPARGWRRAAMPPGFQERLLAALSDDAFRERLAAALVDADEFAGAVGAVDDGGDPAERDAATVGALLFLLRPQGWQERLQQVRESLRVMEEPAGRAAAEAEIAELRSKLQRARLRREQDLAAAEEEAAQLQRHHAATIDRLREQLAAAQQAQQVAEQANADLLVRATESERAVRRLRGEVARVRAEAERLQAGHRDGRIGANSRAKVLLEVLTEALEGLTEELALPESTPAPAELVKAQAPAVPELPQRLHGVEDLRRALGLPRCHLLVDGYNISKGLWPTAPLQQQRDRLVGALRALQARTGAEVTVVFDGADVAGVPQLAATSVRVRFSPAGEPADRVLVALVAAEPSGRPMVVASSDAAVASGARRAGARSADREVLAALLPG